jgi:hypothetical protein
MFNRVLLAYQTPTRLILPIISSHQKQEKVGKAELCIYLIIFKFSAGSVALGFDARTQN